MTWLCLAMEAAGHYTGLSYDTKKMPRGRAKKLKRACTTGQVTVIVPDPEPYTYLSFKLKTGKTCRVVRGVILNRKASWYGKMSFPMHMGNPTLESD